MENTGKQSVNVPDGYNGDLLDGGYALNMDYLILNLTGSPLAESFDGLKIDNADYGTKVFQRMATLTYLDEAFGTMVYKTPEFCHRQGFGAVTVGEPPFLYCPAR